MAADRTVSYGSNRHSRPVRSDHADTAHRARHHRLPDVACRTRSVVRCTVERRSAKRARPPIVADPNYVVVNLDFDTVDEANAFLQLLETVVWSSPAKAPALAGSPGASVLERAPATSLTR